MLVRLKILEKLRRSKNIIIIRSDERNGVVVMDIFMSNITCTFKRQEQVLKTL